MRPLLVILALLCDQAFAADTRPNIIVVLADDVGLSRISGYGGAPFKTPNLDRLAATGVKFERCYSMPLCGPSRGALLTGCYPFRTGYLDNNTSAIDPKKHPTMANLLQKAGYATCAIGKLGQSAPEDDTQAPRRLGFDDYMLWMGRGTPDRYWHPRYCRNGEFVQGRADEYGPDVTHAFLVEFMQRHREQPFFAYYSAVLAHVPLARTPDSKPDEKDPAQLLIDMVGYLDKQMGRLADDLDRLGLRERTIIVFTSDNGPIGPPLGTVHGRPILGIKGQTLEGGVREPLIVNCPQLVPAGRVCADLTDFTDLLPTVLDLAEVPLPAIVKIDGRSIAPQILGQPGRPRDWVYAQVGRNYFIADQHHKLYGNGKLVDIRESPVAEMPVPPDEANAAREKLAAHLAKLRADDTPAKPALAPEMSLPDALEVLVKHSVITNANDWQGKATHEGAVVGAMIIKAASQFEPTTELAPAIHVLHREGILKSTGYWTENAKAGRTCTAANVTRLMQKLAARLLQ